MTLFFKFLKGLIPNTVKYPAVREVLPERISPGANKRDNAFYSIRVSICVGNQPGVIFIEKIAPNRHFSRMPPCIKLMYISSNGATIHRRPQNDITAKSNKFHIYLIGRRPGRPWQLHHRIDPGTSYGGISLMPAAGSDNGLTYF